MRHSCPPWSPSWVLCWNLQNLPRWPWLSTIMSPWYNLVRTCTWHLGTPPSLTDNIFFTGIHFKTPKKGALWYSGVLVQGSWFLPWPHFQYDSWPGVGIDLKPTLGQTSHQHERQGRARCQIISGSFIPDYLDIIPADKLSQFRHGRARSGHYLPYCFLEQKLMKAGMDDLQTVGRGSDRQLTNYWEPEIHILETFHLIDWFVHWVEEEGVGVADHLVGVHPWRISCLRLLLLLRLGDSLLREMVKMVRAVIMLMVMVRNEDGGNANADPSWESQAETHNY